MAKAAKNTGRGLLGFFPVQWLVLDSAMHPVGPEGEPRAAGEIPRKRAQCANRVPVSFRAYEESRRFLCRGAQKQRFFACGLRMAPVPGQSTQHDSLVGFASRV